jgi:hypothetical protein
MKNTGLTKFYLVSIISIILLSCVKNDVNPYGDTNGNYTFWMGNHGAGSVSVYIDNKLVGQVTKYSTTEVECGEGEVNVILPEGVHSLVAISQGGPAWYSNLEFEDSNCKSFQFAVGNSNYPNGIINSPGTGNNGVPAGTNGCTSMNSYVGVVSAAYTNMCGNTNDMKVIIKNNSTQRLAVRISIKGKNGTWQCGVATPVAGATDSYYVCNSTGEYKIQSLLYTDFNNNCSFGACP